MAIEYSYGVIPLKKQNDQWYVFLIQHLAGHWGFPKGHAEQGEQPFDAASRELNEETGLNIKKNLLEDPFTETYYFHLDGKNTKKTVLYYVAEVEGDERIQPEEIQDSKWVLLSEVEEHLTFRNAASLCQNVRKKILELGC